MRFRRGNLRSSAKDFLPLPLQRRQQSAGFFGCFRLSCRFSLQSVGRIGFRTGFRMGFRGGWMTAKSLELLRRWRRGEIITGLPAVERVQRRCIRIGRKLASIRFLDHGQRAGTHVTGCALVMDVCMDGH